jgi:tetratricopeptide (TPR) repeat protein
MKTIKNNIFTLLVGSLLTLGLYSCTDKFLDEEENYLIDSESYFNSEDDYYMALVGAYDMLQATYVNNLLGEIASDNTLCGGESATDVVGFQQIDNMTHTPVNSNLRDVWNWMFAGVKRTNYFLEFQNKINFDGRVQMVAEVRFLRAYFHFELVKWFGGIPIKNYDVALAGGGARFVTGDETSIPRYSKEQVYALIESDLTFAVNNLEYSAPQVGRVTKGAAQALLGKAYLYQDKFTQAADVLDNLINNGPYQLVEDYSEIFENDGENGVESVFEVQYTDAEGAGFGCLQCSEGNVAVGFMGIRNHTGPLYDSGYSFNVPVQAAYDAYDTDDSRRDVSILDIVAWAATTGASYVEGYEHTGYFNRKYLPRKGDQNIGDQNLTNPNNYRSIRYADVLLMAAEAYNRGGLSDETAKAYLNQVRERAFGDSSNNISVSGEALTDAILEERRFELLGEGHRFFDLVRTGRAAQAIDGFVAGKHDVFPIPFEEIQFSAGNWSQNPNY